MQSQQTRSAAAQPATMEAEASSLTSAEAFDAMRQAATTMFKQRTKDLTRLSELQEHHQRLAQSQREVQGGVEKLQAHQALLDASVEREEQRSKERAAELQKLHGALASLGNEEAVLRDVTRAASQTAELTALAVRDGTDPGVMTRLGRLLEEAQARNAGRTTGDFRHLSTDLRRREALVREFLDDARRTGTVSRGFHQSVQEWQQGQWRQHKELADVVAHCEEVTVALAATIRDSRATSRTHSPAGSPPGDALAGHTYPVSIDEDALFEFAASPNWAADIRQAIAPYLHELAAIAKEVAESAASCEELGVVSEVLAEPLTPIEVGWQEFLAQYAAWHSLVEEGEGISAQAAAATADVASAEATLRELTERCTACEAESADIAAREERLNRELDNYARAWATALRSAQAVGAARAEVTGSAAALQERIDAIKAETLAVEAARREDAERQERALLQQRAAVLDASASADAAAQELCAAQADLSHATGLMGDLETLCQRLTMACSTDTLTQDEAVATLMKEYDSVLREFHSTSSSPSWFAEAGGGEGDGQPTTAPAAAESILALTSQSAEDAAALIGLLPSLQAIDGDTLRAKLGEVLSCRLDAAQTDLLVNEVGAVSEGLLSFLRTAHAGAAEHDRAMSDMTQEMALLTKELA